MLWEHAQCVPCKYSFDFDGKYGGCPACELNTLDCGLGWKGLRILDDAVPNHWEFNTCPFSGVVTIKDEVTWIIETIQLLGKEYCDDIYFSLSNAVEQNNWIVSL